MSKNLTVLGEMEQVSGFRCLGDPSPDELLSIMLSVIGVIGMESDGLPDIRHYPNGHGKGGHGTQIYQALTESWIVGGTWPAHGFTRIVLSSCKPYDIGMVQTILTKLIGPITMTFMNDL